MSHPLSDPLLKAAKAAPGVYYHEVLERIVGEAVAALDAYHKALDGLEVVECQQCEGNGWYTGTTWDSHGNAEPEQVECERCLGTGKRLLRGEA